MLVGEWWEVGCKLGSVPGVLRRSFVGCQLAAANGLNAPAVSLCLALLQLVVTSLMAAHHSAFVWKDVSVLPTWAQTHCCLQAAELPGPQTPIAQPSQPRPPALPAAQPTGSSSRPRLGALQGWLSAAWEGWQYVCSRETRDVALLVSIKAWGALLWGGTDVFNVR